MPAPHTNRKVNGCLPGRPMQRREWGLLVRNFIADDVRGARLQPGIGKRGA